MIGITEGNSGGRKDKWKVRKQNGIENKNEEIKKKGWREERKK